MCPVGWEYATRIDAESPCYTAASGPARPGAVTAQEELLQTLSLIHI